MPSRSSASSSSSSSNTCRPSLATASIPTLLAPPPVSRLKESTSPLSPSAAAAADAPSAAPPAAAAASLAALCATRAAPTTADVLLRSARPLADTYLASGVRSQGASSAAAPFPALAPRFRPPPALEDTPVFVWPPLAAAARSARARRSASSLARALPAPPPARSSSVSGDRPRPPPITCAPPQLGQMTSTSPPAPSMAHTRPRPITWFPSAFHW
mmetsp:Transcript_18925/g.72184  ORF Transcript_18925/g.72184 Transcript_18925/m.72184 type:complete len:215 (+) Transcript_18925:2228-2872(+)